MIRYTFIALTILGTAATAIAAVQPNVIEVAPVSAHTTVIKKNSPFPVVGPIIVEECALEDCSDVQS
jgi:hypothetical protein